MMTIFILSLICDIAFYMIFANIFAQAQFEGAITSLMPLIIMVISACCACFLQKIRARWRFLPLLLLPLCLFWQHNAATAVLLSLPCAYIAITIFLKIFTVGNKWLKPK